MEHARGVITMGSGQSPAPIRLAEIDVPPYPNEFFEEYLLPISPDKMRLDFRCACETCHESVGPDTPLFVVETCGHYVHRSCLLHWVTRLHNEKTSCPQCKIPIMQYMPLVIKQLAEESGIEVEPQIMDPITEFGTTIRTEEELLVLEVKVLKTIIYIFSNLALYIEHHTRRKPNFCEAYLNVMDKVFKVGMPWSKYFESKQRHEILEWRAAIGDMTIRQITDIKPEADSTPELEVLRYEVEQLHEMAEEEREAYEVARLGRHS